MSQIPMGSGPRSTSMSQAEYDHMMLNYFGGSKKAATTDLLGMWIFASILMAFTVTPVVCGLLYVFANTWYLDNMKAVTIGVWAVSSIIAILQSLTSGETQLQVDVIKR